jgi:hypothetical protein
MDYSVFYPSILFMYSILLAAVLVGIILALSVSFYYLKELLKEKGVMNLVAVICFFTIVLVILYFSIDIFCDIPNVIKKNYVITTGIAIDSNNAGQEPEIRGFPLKRNYTNEIIRVAVTYYPINEGDEFEVIYLPNSKIGAIVRKIENPEGVK